MSDANKSSGRSSSLDRSDDGPSEKRVLVANIPQELCKHDLKTLFDEKVGGVVSVELFFSSMKKNRNSAFIQFESADLAKEAIKKMHMRKVCGRKLVVFQEDFGSEDEDTHPFEKDHNNEENCSKKSSMFGAFETWFSQCVGHDEDPDTDDDEGAAGDAKMEQSAPEVDIFVLGAFTCMMLVCSFLESICSVMPLGFGHSC